MNKIRIIDALDIIENKIISKIKLFLVSKSEMHLKLWPKTIEFLAKCDKHYALALCDVLVREGKLSNKTKEGCYKIKNDYVDEIAENCEPYELASGIPQ